MAPETLGPGNLPGILEDPLFFIRHVGDNIRSNSDPKVQSEFKEWLLNQWGKIDSRISTVSYKWAVRPHNKRPRDLERGVKVSDRISVTEPLLNEDVFGGPRVEIHYDDDALILSPESKGKHMARMSFRAHSKETRGLDTVFIEDKSVDVDPEGKPFLKRVGFLINVSPTFNVRELRANESF